VKSSDTVRCVGLRGSRVPSFLGRPCWGLNIAALKLITVNDLNQFKNAHGTMYGGIPYNNSSDGGKMKERYLYSPKWGWIDMKHFSSAALETNKWYKSASFVLGQGEGVEDRQENGEFPNSRPESKASAYDYEDLVSNLLGVGFEAYLETDAAADKDLVENLTNYLTALGFGDPTQAPNYATLPQNHDGDTNVQNTTYDPSYAPQSGQRTNAVDQLVLGILKEHIGSENPDRKVQRDGERAQRQKERLQRIEYDKHNPCK
jgi:hypothetical protein